ncbi:glycoside hydrolase family 32 protein [Chitinophaga silvatica]|uniref:Glycoside hydrolase family 32 protein n=1 Tax=Chitinophaga silvatica TaxID=2282649 RepID=A0A3E1Y495_9BACT|nr:glycoside hydrolase family 32 protein [Chitinophaga silvatica]RFS19483.1 glycoside hydrolase family 32 protein [Chitinophaga silvatica]
MKKIFIPLLCGILTAFFANAQTNSSLYHEQYRPQFHFSPKAHWMNDPNGMVYMNGTYHLFFQYYPDGTTWGPMHWGHTTSKDLIHWEEQSIALYPDSLGYIFSGSAVVDINNTSGFGKDGKPPMVAIYTYHDPVKEKTGSSQFESQAIAYSLDAGRTWTKYSGNPVLQNPGIRDFRDPKVSWYAPAKKWIMTLATQDRITFYSSPNLKQWTKESDFGAAKGAHGGVWECPDLFPLTYQGKEIWVLIVNINPGGPNGGSATQYFTGNFNGHTFTPGDTLTKWIDYGPDEYAGITWSNTGKQKIFLGWMSNWQYANEVPTSPWRSASTIPRTLSLKKTDGVYRVASVPVKEVDKQIATSQTFKNITADFAHQPAAKPLKISLQADASHDFELTFLYADDQKVKVGYHASTKEYYIDRTNAGEHSFNRSFASIHHAPRFSGEKEINMTLILDAASVELFADEGLTVMTSIFFIKSPLQVINSLSSLKNIRIETLNGIWP